MQQLTLQQAYDLALEHANASRFAEAEQIARQILAAEPNQPDSLNLLGYIAHAHGHLEPALALFTRATEIAPNVAHLWINRAETHRSLQQLDMVLHCYQEAARCAPDNAQVHASLGALHIRRDEIPEAEAALERALSLKPDYVEPLSNMAVVRRFQNDVAGWIDYCERIIATHPDFAPAHDGLGHALLLSGDFRRGWKEHEWRWRTPDSVPWRRDFTQPEWDGSSLTGKRILIHTEQGLGDGLQFCRYIPLIKALGAYVIFEVFSELEPIMRTLEGWDELFIRRDGMAHLPAFDAHVPLMSLPRLMGTDLNTIPADIPYLSADAAKSAGWRERLAGIAPGLKVGIAWAGLPSHFNDIRRSMPLEAFRPIAEVPSVFLISLQKGVAAEQIKTSPGIIALDAAPDLNDFTDTAALIVNLDLVVAVDTSVVHLAGALGRPVFILLSYAGEWRWLLHRSDSPWYPTARLFRQPNPGDWQRVVADVRGVIEAMTP